MFCYNFFFAACPQSMVCLVQSFHFKEQNNTQPKYIKKKFIQVFDIFLNQKKIIYSFNEWESYIINNNFMV